MDLPELVKGSLTKIAPVVSSKRAVALLLKSWDKKYARVPDFIVVEGPEAGGHLGFSKEQLNDMKKETFEAELVEIIGEKKKYEEKYQKNIPVFMAGGVWDAKDAKKICALGADGVQAATRFVATKECDASEAYKMAYVNAKPEEVKIIKSPVGMPGRALNNELLKEIGQNPVKISHCYRCIKNCHPSEIPYCITKALVAAVQGDVEHGLVFCGGNVGRIEKIETVHEVVEDLMYENIL